MKIDIFNTENKYQIIYADPPWEYKQSGSTKNSRGMGAYTRANAEICLIGISKKTKAKEMVKAYNIYQIIMEPVEQHSKKPAIVRDKIIELLGDLPKIELFAREHLLAGIVGGMRYEF